VETRNMEHYRYFGKRFGIGRDIWRSGAEKAGEEASEEIGWSEKESLWVIGETEFNPPCIPGKFCAVQLSGACDHLILLVAKFMSLLCFLFSGNWQILNQGIHK
jgi:hypothetical protein